MSAEQPDLVRLVLCSDCARIAGTLPADELRALAGKAHPETPAPDGTGTLLGCPRCGHTLAYRSSGGALDIGVVR